MRTRFISRPSGSSALIRRIRIGRGDDAILLYEITVYMDMGEGPELFGRREDPFLGPRHLDRRQRLAVRRRRVLEFAVFHDDKGEPWPKAVADQIRRRRRIAPGKVLLVELDIREVVRLEIGDPVMGVCFDNSAWVNAYDVTGPVDLNLFFISRRRFAITVNIESRVPAATIAALKAMGHTVEVAPGWGSLGHMQVIRIDAKTGTMTAGADPRRTGYAMGY